VKRETSTASQ